MPETKGPRRNQTVCAFYSTFGICSPDIMRECVLVVDAGGRVLFANKSFSALTGRSVGDDSPLNLSDFIHPDDIPEITTNIRAVPGKEPAADCQYCRVLTSRDELVTVECSMQAVESADGSDLCQVVMRDLTGTGRKMPSGDEDQANLLTAKATTILGLARLAEFRDEDTGAHLSRIREFSRLLASELANHPNYQGYIKDTYVEDIYQSSILHDIGKVGISDTVLLKPGRLTREEFESIKQHTGFGGNVLDDIDNQIDGQSFLALGKQIAYFHHEKWDGSGYPRGLAGDKIPLSARIVAVADVYDALTSKRPYKKAFSHEEACNIIKEGSGAHFDPDLVDVFLANHESFRRIRFKLHKDD